MFHHHFSNQHSIPKLTDARKVHVTPVEGMGEAVRPGYTSYLTGAGGCPLGTFIPRLSGTPAWHLGKSLVEEGQADPREELFPQVHLMLHPHKEQQQPGPLNYP